jgi:thiosulfate/3-mercaptopyruvate sulfurtransferase
MIFPHLITTSQLAEFRKPDWVIIDCRFDLSKPDWGFLNYQEGHLPDAIYAHLDQDLSGKVTQRTGRHPLPDPDIFSNKLTAWGIQKDTQVVVYDTTGGSFAVRLWWMMRYYGHSQVALLDGGFPMWLRENRAIQIGVYHPNPASIPFVPSFHREMLVSADEVEKIHQNPLYLLIDARSSQRFSGELEPIDSVAGHIPGALNRFHVKNLTHEGVFKSPSILQIEFTRLLKNTPPENVVVYCGSGVTSCHHLLAMEIAGLKGARLFAGSWSEWIRDPNRPIAVNA